MNIFPNKQIISSPDQPPRMHSFLLRCIETRNSQEKQTEPDSGWLFSLQNSHDNETYNFQNLEKLMTFIKNVLDIDLKEGGIQDLDQK